MKRRDFLRSVPLGFAATCVPLLGAERLKANTLLNSPMLTALTNPTAETDRVVVVIWLEGGNDGLNTVIPFEDPLYDSNRQKIGFSQPDDKKLLIHKVRDDLALNPALASAFPLFQEGKMAIVQGVGFVNPDLSHFRAADIWTSGSDIDVLEPTGWIARWLGSEHPDYPSLIPPDPLALSIGEFSSSLFHGPQGQMDILLDDPSQYQVSNSAISSSIPNNYGGRELQFIDDLISVSDHYSQRFQDLFPKYSKNMVDYPDTDFAQHLRHTAWCIAAGLQTKVYFTKESGFDTHYYENSKDSTVEGQAAHLKNVFDAIAAFQRDLELLGIADRVITMTYSEFGRRISEDGAFDSGTDHGSSAPQFIIGSNVNGELYGLHPDLKNLDPYGNLVTEYEFRNLYASILGDWFGVSSSTAQTILSPGKPHAPFESTFGVNGTAVKQSLIRNKVTSRVQTAPSIVRNERCYPNPCVTESTISFEVLNRSTITVELFDEAANRVFQRYLGSLGRGSHEFAINFQSLSAGRYLYRITAGDQTIVGSVVCQK